jgi:myo-inositol-hexaphosphate 3-phosphohydrolase
MEKVRGCEQGHSSLNVSNRLALSKLILTLFICMVLGGLILMAYYFWRPVYGPTRTNMLVPNGAAVVSTPVYLAQTHSPTETVYLPLVTKPPDATQMRPYSETSVWNTPIGSAPRYDTHSNEMIATIGLVGGRQITSDPSQYTYPVYFADETTPRWDIPCTRYKCTIVTPEGTSRTRQLTDVPIPPEAQPSRGTDAQMIIIDKTTYAEYDLYEVIRTDTGWSVSNGSVYNILWDGTPTKYGSRGAGVPYYAGLIRPLEIAGGRIEHALAFGYHHPAEDRCVFPASKTDGNSTLPYAIPEAARLQLDPSLTEADFDEIGLDRTGKIIARALQEYGMFVIDGSGRPKIYAEDLENNPYATLDWSDPELNLTSTTIADIPIDYFRVLALPEAYWDPALEGPFHGGCYAYSDVADSAPAAGPASQPTPTRTPTPAPTSFEAFGKVTIEPDFEVSGQGRNVDSVAFEPDFEVSGQGRNVDSVAFWEAPDPADTLMFITAKNNQLVEVWQYPFENNQLPSLKHASFGSDTRVNGVIVDQESNRLFVSVSEPASTVSVFSLPELEFVGEFVEGDVNLESEPNITLLKHTSGQTWAYVSADDIVYIHNAETGAQIGQFKPAKGLETLVADDFYQVIHIPDENNKTGIYAYDPDGTPYERGGTNNFGGGDIFRSDAEGIVLYTCPADGTSDNGNGLLIVAEQKSSKTDFEFFDRQTWEHLGKVRLEGVSNTDGIATIQRSLPDYPWGIFVAINDDTSLAAVGWDKIFGATDLSCGTQISR